LRGLKIITPIAHVLCQCNGCSDAGSVLVAPNPRSPPCFAADFVAKINFYGRNIARATFIPRNRKINAPVAGDRRAVQDPRVLGDLLACARHCWWLPPTVKMT
jgi:hypothetical protein